MINIKIANIFVLYIGGTFLLYALGPIVYLGESYKLDSAIFLLLVCLFFYLGCLTIPVNYKNILHSVTEKRLKFFKNILFTSFFLSLILLVDNLSSSDFSLGTSLGEVYIKSHDREKDLDEISRIAQLAVLFSPVRVLSFVLSAYFYFKVQKKIKLVIILNILVYLFYEIFCLGTQKGVGNTVIFTLIGLYMHFLQKREITKFIKYVFWMLLAFVSFFVISQLSRSSAYGSDFSASLYFHVDKDSLMYTAFGESIGEGLSAFLMYLSHGYHGLGMCLQLPFEWTGFYGSSFALTSYLEQYFGFPSMLDMTYPMRMQSAYGWPALMFWPTAFSWLASDFTFPGVVVLMFFMGRFFCVLFKEAYYYSNPISLGLLGYLCIQIVFLPSNNQIFQTRESFVGLVILFVLWLFWRKKFNYQ